jgi:hypothetical protein
MGEYAQALGHGSRLPDAPCSSEHASTHAHSALSRHSMHVTCPAELIGRIRVGVRVGVDRALVAFHNAACEGARRPNYIVEGKRCCHCTSSNTKLGFLLPMQAIVGARARSITSNFGAFGASLFVAIATVHSPTCHNPIPVFSPPVPDSMSTHLFSSSLLLFSPPFSFFSFPYRALVTRVWPAAPVTTPKICRRSLPK